jgi:hypothetical protein
MACCVMCSRGEGWAEARPLRHPPPVPASIEKGVLQHQMERANGSISQLDRS